MMNNSQNKDKQPDLSSILGSGSENQQNSNQDIKDLLNQSLEDYKNTKNTGISKEDIDNLSSHAAANKWSNLFMSLIGGTNNVNPQKSIDINNQSLQNEKDLLNLKGKYGQQQKENAVGGQAFGLNQFKGSQALQQQDIAQGPANNVKIGTLLGYMKQAGLYDANNKDSPFSIQDVAGLTNAQADQAINDIQKMATNESLTTRNTLNNQTKKILLPIQNENGTIGYGLASKLDNSITPIEGTVVPQANRMEQQQTQAFTKNVTPSIEAHRAVKNYETAFDNLSPEEAQKADDLARRQVSAIAGKFDQGVRANVITNANQLLNTITKYSQTEEFNTPENPAIGEAAFRRVKSALEFAAINQAGKTRPSNFATQFSLGNSFGANIAGQPVPSEKINELLHQTKQNIGGNLKSAIAGMQNSELGKQKAKEIFGNDIDDYLDAYSNIEGPGKKVKTGMNIPAVNKTYNNVISGDEYLQSLGK